MGFAFAAPCEARPDAVPLVMSSGSNAQADFDNSYLVVSPMD